MSNQNDESIEQDPFLRDDFTKPSKPRNLFHFMDEVFDDDIEEDDESWKKYWVGMPEFVQEDNPAYKKLIISFRTKEDYEEFAKIIGQKLTEKTKSIWHPKLDRDENTLKRWIEE